MNSPLFPSFFLFNFTNDLTLQRKRLMNQYKRSGSWVQLIYY